MSGYIVYKAALISHIIGISLMAGATCCQMFLYSNYWKQMRQHLNSLHLKAIIRLETLVIIGLVIMLLSGGTMLYLVNGIYEQQTWFQLKIIIIAILIFNGAVVKKRMAKKMIDHMEIYFQDRTNQEFIKTSKWMTAIITFELLMFLMIFTLAVFKVN